MKKVTLKKTRRKQISRQLAIVHEALLPESTLQSVGENWGISRQRVSKIFLKVTRKSYSVVRADLLKSSTKFSCSICGIPVNPRLRRIYCSKRCYNISIYYDLKSPKVCKYCGKEFFPYRGSTSPSQSSRKYIPGQYCCLKHYMLNHTKKDGRFSRNSTIVEKLKHLGGNHGS